MADKSFTDGEYIFREGESAAYAYVVNGRREEDQAGREMLVKVFFFFHWKMI